MKVVIIGTGYVGMVTGACLADLGHDVVCVDNDVNRSLLINEGKAPFYEKGLDELIVRNVDFGRLQGSVDLQEAMYEAELSIIAVGTPSIEGRIDLSYVENAGLEIGHLLGQAAKYHTIVLKSTCVPGTTKSLLRKAIETTSGAVAGVDFGLGMSPEFLREGSAVQDFIDPDRLVIGADDDRSAQTIAALYDSFTCKKIFTTTSNAEMIKYTSNALLSNLISFSNEISTLCETVEDLNEEVVMHGLHMDRRLSPVVQGNIISPEILTYLRAGIGYGGSCFPKDTLALQYFARDLNVATPMLDATISVNNLRANTIVDLIEKALGTVEGRSLTILGLAFKPDTDDVRESPGVRLAEVFVERGAIVCGWDPIAIKNAQGLLPNSVDLTDNLTKALTGSELAVIATAWSQLKNYDWSGVCHLMERPAIFDGRSIISRESLPSGVSYHSIGEMPKILDGDMRDDAV